MAVEVSETRRFSQRARSAGRLSSRALRTVTRATGLTSSGLILVALSVGSWLLGYLVAGRPLFYLAYGGLVVLAISWAIGRRPLPLEGSRAAARSRRKEGETISMAVTLTAQRRLNTFILEERIPDTLGQDAHIPVASLEPGESVDHDYRLTCWRRGVYQLGPLVARWGDPFGFTEREVVLAEPFEFVVHPSTENVMDRPLTRLWEDPPIRPPISKPWPTGMEFYGMREYAPGDDTRRVVWRAFARTGKLLVREAEQGISDKVTILLDSDVRNHSTGVFSESFEAACKTAASLGVNHLKEGFSVTVEGNGAKLVGPLRGPNAPMELLDALARAEPEDERLGEAITRAVFETGRNANVIVITPMLEADAAARLQLLREGGSSVLVAALMWDELAAETLPAAASLGCQIVEVRPNTPLAVSFRHEIGGGRR